MKTHINLLPWKCRQSQTFRLRLFRWSFAWTAAALMVGGVYWIKAEELATARAEADRLQDQYTPIETMRKEIAAARQRLDQWSKRQAIVAQLEDSRPPLALLALVSRSASQCAGRLRVEQLTVRTSEPATKPQENKPSEKTLQKNGQEVQAVGRVSVATATIKGTAGDNLAVARFVLALRQTDAFDRVELKSAAGHPVAGTKACSYLVECVY